MSVQELIDELNLVPESLRACVPVLIDWEPALDCTVLDEKTGKRFLIQSGA